jgi:hypothetical protein
MSGIKLVSELRLLKVLISMAAHGHRDHANQPPAAQERDPRDIEMDDLRRQIQQLQERLEHYEAFEHRAIHDDGEYEDVEDPSQGFVDWDSPPTYDININDEDLLGGSLSYDHENESIVDWVSPLIDNIYREKEEPLEKVNISDDIENFVDESSTHHVLDESPKSEVFDLNVNEVVFLGVENILSNSFDVNAFDDFFWGE